MFVEVEKITEKKGTTKIVVESINLNEIKGFRAWHKSESDQKEVKGDITILYLQSSSSDEKNDMRINENYDKFVARIGTLKLTK